MNKELMNRILKDIKVELSDEFDQNFKRKAFFDKPWPKRQHSYPRGTLMSVTNRLRRSFRGSASNASVQWRSDAPYAAIHNEGGKIAMTPRMRSFFWAQYYKKSGMVSKTKGGKISASQRNVALSSEAQFYKNMALSKKESFVIPQRKMIGNHKKVKETVDKVAVRAIKEYAENKLLKTLKK